MLHSHVMSPEQDAHLKSQMFSPSSGAFHVGNAVLFYCECVEEIKLLSSSTDVTAAVRKSDKALLTKARPAYCAYTLHVCRAKWRHHCFSISSVIFRSAAATLKIKK